MTHTYQVTGMTCSGCENKVKSSLLLLPDVSSVEVSKETNAAVITMNKHIGINDLQNALGGKDAKYQISAIAHSEFAEQTRSWLTIYSPVLLLFAYISAVASIAAWQNQQFELMRWMQIFMAGFFLSFSFFKMLNLRAFAESYAMYDVIAKKFKFWGFIYAFIELFLGLAYAIDFNQQLINWITLVVMSVSMIGVLESVLNKRKIQCACLGAVFDLPMSTLTIVENMIMIAMSAIMLILI